jgi:hypothetical protein
MTKSFWALVLCAGYTCTIHAATLEEKVDILTQEVEALKAEKAASGGTDASRGRTTVGGYGELHFNNLENQQTGSGLDRLDFHRFVLFFGHEFNDRIRFYSELELEHAFIESENECEFVVPPGGLAPGDVVEADCEAEAPGELELEQAYVQFDITNAITAQGGLFLVPVGILNETHEPPTFYGVERNPVESQIVPSTWWEGGALVNFKLPAGLSADVAYTSGLEVGSNFSIRSGRQKVANADANDPAYTGRLKWTGIPGLEVAGTIVYQKDIGQGLVAGLEDATLLETHVVFSKGPFGLRALYATWDLNGTAPAAAGADEQTGYYVEPSLRFGPVGVFVRYNLWDTRAGDAVASERTQTDLGVNYWPHEQVVIKADIQKQDNDIAASNNEIDGFNLGIGYMF